MSFFILYSVAGGFMKKIKWILIGLGGILVLWILFNQIDGPKPKNVFTVGDLRASNFDPGNGFYILWGLIEPPEVDITSPEVIQIPSYF